MKSSRRFNYVPNVPSGPVVVSYGGGVNSVAALVMLRRLDVTPTAIVMADPGSEWRQTVDYRDVTMAQWLNANGFPQITVIDRASEGAYRERAWRLETLLAECLRIKALPSVAYGFKKCSQKYKGETQRWWIERQQWARDVWRERPVRVFRPDKNGRVRKTTIQVVTGAKIVKVIGYDAGEPGRVRGAFQNDWEAERMVPFYPLVDANADREDCEELILSEGLPLPHKSACRFCPNNTIEEWHELRAVDPAGFAEAVELSRNAEADITDPDVVGLMRCNPHGKRQLHVWAAGGYSGSLGGREDAQPCECAL